MRWEKDVGKAVHRGFSSEDSTYFAQHKVRQRLIMQLLMSLAVFGFVGAHDQLRHAPRREHLVRRLYDTPARAEASRLEERMTRYTTGFNHDPDHALDYGENHPYDRRNLQEKTTNTTDVFRPIRIEFHTKALDDTRNDENAAKIDWYKQKVLPIAAKFWSETLSVVPVSGALRISSGELDSFVYCGDKLFSEVPNEHKSDGIRNADLVLYVSGSASSPRFCPSRTLAVAVPCNFDQFDRPTAGAINVCLGSISLQPDGTASQDVWQDYVDVTIHEIGHVLGHSSNSYRFFWDSETGQPRSPRPFSERTVTCVNGETKSLNLPDENTMRFGEDPSGRRYASIVTPKVQAVVRNQFDCQVLEGAPLENQPTRSESCTGDHWDERLFYPEALSGVISPTTNILSSLTLALMEDSGWYKANYTNSRMSPWGLGAGCDFVHGHCLVQDGEGETVVPDYGRGFFCTKSIQKGCSSEHSHKLSCNVLDYSLYEDQVGPPEPYVYFDDSPLTGGPRQADFCPVFGVAYNNLKSEQLDCSNNENTPALNVYSEVFGPESKCINSNLGEGLCFRTACVRDDMSLRINVLGEWKVCEHDFQKHDIAVGQGLLRTSITCPRLSQACPDLFCPFNCAGRGECDYSHTVNGTKRPKCNCFDPSDTSEACSDSLVPDGAFLDNAGGLLDNIEENFFDPLIQVFVDHPDAWPPASWAWAGGLATVFLVLLLCFCSSACPSRKRKR